MPGNEVLEDTDFGNDKKYHTNVKLKDQVSAVREKALDNFRDRRPGPLIEYYLLRRPRMKEYLPDMLKAFDRLAKESGLFDENCIQLTKMSYIELFDILDYVGEYFSEYGYVNIKKDVGEKYYDIDIFFDFLKNLYGPGLVNILYGKMGDGKTNFIVYCAKKLIERGDFIICSNIGMKFRYDYHKATWMKNLLKVLAENAQRNIDIEEEIKRIDKENKEIEKHNKKEKDANPGNPKLKEYLKYPEKKIKNVACFLDEIEQFIVSHRSSSKNNVEFNMFVQMSRKLYTSFTLIGHRKADFPQTILDNPSLNAEIIKGLDMEGKPTPYPQKDVYIKFPDYDYYLGDIPYIGDMYDTREIAGFAISNDNFPETSIDMNEIFRILQDKSFKQVPEAILSYIYDIEHPKVEEKPDYSKVIRERALELSNAIEVFKHKSQFSTYLITDFEEKYGGTLPDDFERQCKDIGYKVFDRAKLEESVKDAVDVYNKSDLTLEQIASIIKSIPEKRMKKNRDKFKWRDNISNNDIAILNIQYGIGGGKLAYLMAKGKKEIDKIIKDFKEVYEDPNQELSYDAVEDPYSIKHLKDEQENKTRVDRLRTMFEGGN